MDLIDNLYSLFPSLEPSAISNLQSWVQGLELNTLLIVGILTFVGFYAGKSMKFIKLPSIIGFMVLGVIAGPSLFDLLGEHVQLSLSFITEIALGFVALSIGLELSFPTLKKQGKGIVIVIFAESILAFVIVTTAVYLLTNDLPLALIFGAIAPASAPAGTVAVIQEYKATGSLTQALYTVVGFDDGLGIIIFGFAAAIAKSLLGAELGGHTEGFFQMMAEPLKEVGLSVFVGIAMGFVFSFFASKLKSDNRGYFILIFAFVLITTGLCGELHLSLILTNMIMGIFVVNTQRKMLVEKMGHEMRQVMPLLFILFFVLAGSNLHVAALPSLGLLGLVYVLARTIGLMSGAYFGSKMGKLDDKIKKYLGMGILSQAGVAIGLSLIVKKEFAEFGAHGLEIGSIVITTVTVTCIFFELIGPFLTKIGLEKAGEIKVDKK